MGPLSCKGGGGRALRVAAILVLALSAGCAGSRGAPPGSGDAGGKRPAPATGSPPTGRPPQGSTAATTPPSRLDPSEEITPEELASIPEPLPGSSPARQGAEARSTESVAPTPSGGPSEAPQESRTATSEPSATSPWIWRVQIFASDEREEAEWVGHAAAQALSAPASVDREGSLYKVRLGKFATEREAQELRERAMKAGYRGAFRIRTAASGSGVR